MWPIGCDGTTRRGLFGLSNGIILEAVPSGQVQVLAIPVAAYHLQILHQSLDMMASVAALSLVVATLLLDNWSLPAPSPVTRLWPDPPAERSAPQCARGRHLKRIVRIRTVGVLQWLT